MILITLGLEQHRPSLNLLNPFITNTPRSIDRSLDHSTDGHAALTLGTSCHKYCPFALQRSLYNSNTRIKIVITLDGVTSIASVRATAKLPDSPCNMLFPQTWRPCLLSNNNDDRRGKRRAWNTLFEIDRIVFRYDNTLTTTTVSFKPGKCGVVGE